MLRQLSKDYCCYTSNVHIFDTLSFSRGELACG